MGDSLFYNGLSFCTNREFVSSSVYKALAVHNTNNCIFWGEMGYCFLLSSELTIHLNNFSFFLLGLPLSKFKSWSLPVLVGDLLFNEAVLLPMTILFIFPAHQFISTQCRFVKSIPDKPNSTFSGQLVLINVTPFFCLYHRYAYHFCSSLFWHTICVMSSFLPWQIH